ncbi:unnamed protein product [Closterium sp. NIES-54]
MPRSFDSGNDFARFAGVTEAVAIATFRSSQLPRRGKNCRPNDLIFSRHAQLRLALIAPAAPVMGLDRENGALCGTCSNCSSSSSSAAAAFSHSIPHSAASRFRSLATTAALHSLIRITSAEAICRVEGPR